ncbi:unnamed protein product, partial [Durusdinium trenchii]
AVIFRKPAMLARRSAPWALAWTTKTTATTSSASDDRLLRLICIIDTGNLEASARTTTTINAPEG